MRHSVHHSVYLAIVLAVVLLGCDARQPDDARHSPQARGRSSPPLILSAAPTLLLTPAGLGPVPLCAQRDSVPVLLGVLSASVRDSAFAGQPGIRPSPGKVATLAAGGSVWFESSWTDSVPVWRIVTHSPAVRTRSGAHVGMRVDSLPATSGPLAVDGADAVVFFLEGDSVAMMVDSASARVFEARYDGADPPANPASLLPPSARVVELTVWRRCDG